LADKQAKEIFYERIREAEEKGEDWTRKFKKWPYFEHLIRSKKSESYFSNTL
jgi:hypothetical protein